MPREPRDVVRLVEIRDTPLLVDDVLDRLDEAVDGGVTLFVGKVRDHDGGRAVSGLDYSAHPSALERLREVCQEVAARHDVHGVAALHRVGRLAIGDLAVVVGTAAAHRGTAFDASRDLIDTLKERVPIWKHQVFADGSDEWVGTP
ncbi:molybdenum cofactor biosynthesis protein MoaE [Nocardioides dongxiaopingii]|uniref:molybdenum cofactor biosynthesis protein MoaE n=1 Tax=Nocardioides TaxID=1839 RepID=UPI0010C76DB8|nr:MULTISPECIES: molybdenum cofactor biosynthesis protein MoaE [Nocardioides]QCW50330.1 molybdenum cofactor biosynthesis protein MoaE [Nocardioides sp. S-1144]